ncbi:MAG: ribbon-helix-helix domain-containing protein [Pseudomonadota bacterium]
MTATEQREDTASLYESTRRSVRLRGSVTSIRLENGFWQVLGEMAEADKLSLPQLINKLHNELDDTQIESRNFASFLRVVCAQYLTDKAQPEPPPLATEPASELTES